MRNFFKLAAAGALLGTGLWSQAALADTALPSTGNGELVLYATYTSGGTVFTYARGTGVQINAVNGGSNAALAADASYTDGKALSMQFGATNSLAPDANLSAFLANAASAGQTVQWGVMAGDNTGGPSRNPGSNRYLSTTLTNYGTSPTALVNSNLVAQFGSLNQMQIDTNTAIATGVALDKASVFPNGQYGQGLAYSNSGDWFGSNFPNSAGVGSSQSFYLLTGGGGLSTGAVRDYLVGTFSMNVDGTLTFTSAGQGAVPLPAAVWLFGSGLLGLAGVGRRRLAA